jgi:hypothetical protein
VNHPRVLCGIKYIITILDLLFLASFLVSVIALAIAPYAAIRGRTPRALSILRVWLVCVVLYLGTSVAVAYAAPQRVIALGTPWCFDDWCLTVENVYHADKNYIVDLRISSEAKRVTQRAKGAWIYLRDENDTHYGPVPDPAEVPLDVLLQPGESVTAKRSFQVPADVNELGLVTGHGGGGPPCGVMSLVIIGQGGCLFHKQTMIRLPIE